MNSWTAEFEWLDPAARVRAEEWTGALEWDAVRVHVEDTTGKVTATVTVEAPTLAEAMPVAVQLAETVMGHQARLRRMTSTASSRSQTTQSSGFPRSPR